MLLNTTDASNKFLLELLNDMNVASILSEVKSDIPWLEYGIEISSTLPETRDIDSKQSTLNSLLLFATTPFTEVPDDGGIAYIEEGLKIARPDVLKLLLDLCSRTPIDNLIAPIITAGSDYIIRLYINSQFDQVSTHANALFYGFLFNQNIKCISELAKSNMLPESKIDEFNPFEFLSKQDLGRDVMALGLETLIKMPVPEAVNYIRNKNDVITYTQLTGCNHLELIKHALTPRAKKALLKE
jgi:hypothetical protein